MKSISSALRPASPPDSRRTCIPAIHIHIFPVREIPRGKLLARNGNENVAGGVRAASRRFAKEMQNTSRANPESYLSTYSGERFTVKLFQFRACEIVH